MKGALKMLCTKLSCQNVEIVSAGQDDFKWAKFFSNFSCMFLNPNIFFQFELLLFFFIWFEEQVKKAFWYQKLFWPFTVWINCSSDLKKISNNSRPSNSKFKSFSHSLQHFFLTVGQNNLGNKIPFLLSLETKQLLPRRTF